MTSTRTRLIKYFVAVLLGNILYFLLSPHLPSAAQHRSWEVDLGTLVDFWFCLLIYGLIELGTQLYRAIASNRHRKE